MSGCLCLRKSVADVYTLDYRHSNLDFIPSDVFKHERTLEELVIDSNGIKELPRELFCCHGLKKLSLSDNEVRTIPPALASLINLEHIDVSKNGVVTIPDNIKFCKNLKIIEASVNPLGKLPEGFTQLHQLTELYLNDAFLDFLPGSFGRLSKLKILEIRENHLKTLPRSFSHMLLLQRLDIGNNDFTEIPDVVGNLTSLLELWGDSNQIKSLPPSIGNLKQLMFLDLSKNRVETLPTEIEGCVALADLHLSINMLQHLPESLGRLSNLTTLKVDDNRLTSLPLSVGGMVSLSELNVSANDLEELPSSIGLLRHLRTLYSDENFIVRIPPELGSCSGLTVLSLRSNNLTRIPDEIGRIPRLRVLNLSDNKIKFLPFSLTRLKELQALWLAENQTKPLIRLQSDIDEDTGQRMLTCYLLPQQPNDDKEDMYSDAGSFHPSLWEEERAQRQQIHFDTEGLNEQEGKLRRQPTPFPKEMKHRIQHMRNLALKELNVPEAKAQGTSTQSQQPVVGRRDSPSKCDTGGSTGAGSVVTGSIPKTTSPLEGERHHLYRADKEKLQRDKARMQQNRTSSQGLNHSADTLGKDEDDGGFLSNTVRRRGSTSSQGSTLPRSVSVDRNISVTNPPLSPPSKSAPHIADGSQRQPRSNVSYNDFMRGLAARGVPITDNMAQQLGSTRSFPNQSRPHGNHAHHHNYHPMPRSRGRRSGYESDTAYYSEAGYRSDAGYLSDTGYRSEHGAQRRKANSTFSGHNGYSSDYSGPAPRSRSRHNDAASDYESYTKRSSGNHSNHQAWSSGRSQQSHHSNHAHHGNHKQNPNMYTNVPISKRMTIRNDEMYEQHPRQAAGQTALKPILMRSRSTEQDMTARSNSSLHADSLCRPTRGRTESMNSDSRSVTRSVHEPIKEESNGGNDDAKYKSQLYNASVKLQKTPSLEKTNSKPTPRNSIPHLVQPITRLTRYSEVVQSGQCRDSPRDGSSSLATSPPYRPAPPYSANHMTSHQSLHDNQSTAGTPMSQRSHQGPPEVKVAPRGHEVTPRGQVEKNGVHNGSCSRDRPNTLPLGDNRSPHIRKQLYPDNSTDQGPREIQDSTEIQGSRDIQGSRNMLDRSQPDLSINTDCGVLDTNHNTPIKQTESQYNPPGRSTTTTPGRSQGPGPPGGVVQQCYSTPQSNQHISYNPQNHITPQNHVQTDNNTRQSHTPQSHANSHTPQSHTNSHTPQSHKNSHTSQSHKNSHDSRPHGPHTTPAGPHTMPAGPHTTPAGPGPWKLSNYEKDVAVFKQLEPVSQVSSSTDSGYGHTQLFDRTPGDHNRSSVSTSGQPSPAGQSSSPGQPGPGGKHVFHVSLKKDPGLGFSIAGGVGSPGNPFRPNDLGIFITRVQTDGPGAGILKPADKILEVNGVNFVHLEHSHAVDTLRHSGQTVSLVIERS